METITLEDIKGLQHKGMNTLSSKVIYLMVKEGANEEGWSTISVREFSLATGLTGMGVKQVIKKLLTHGLIEKQEEKKHFYHTNQYRIVNHV